MTRRGGAALVVVLAAAAVVAAVVHFGFANDKAARTHAEHQRLVSVLEIGLRAAVESLRTGKLSCGDSGTPLRIENADGLSPAITDVVSCTLPDSAGAFSIEVDASSQPDCLEADAVKTVVAGKVTPRITSRRIAAAAGCSEGA